MSASLVRRDSLVRPGGTVTYSVWVWSTIASRQVTTSISSSGQGVDKPKFALCPAAHRTTCAVGSLPAYQAFEVLVTDHIRKKATPGEQIGLTVIVQGSGRRPSGGTLSPAEAAVSAVLDQASSSPAPPPVVGSIPASVPGLPGTTVTPPSDLTNLFPVVTPSPTPSTSRQEKRKITKATSTASSLPLDSRLIGGQVAGLAVLAAAITMVVARLSLRSPQTAAVSQSGTTAAAAPPPPPSPADAETDSSETG